MLTVHVSGPNSRLHAEYDPAFILLVFGSVALKSLGLIGSAPAGDSGGVVDG